MVFAHQIETVLFGDVLVFFHYKIIGNKGFHTNYSDLIRVAVDVSVQTPPKQQTKHIRSAFNHVIQGVAF